MKLSTKGRYGLRAMIDLASHEEEGAVSIASISERQNISESYLEQLVRPLRKAGFIESVRGAGGGWCTARARTPRNTAGASSTAAPVGEAPKI